jgi:hypothetical protein
MVLGRHGFFGGVEAAGKRAALSVVVKIVVFLLYGLHNWPRMYICFY